MSIIADIKYPFIAREHEVRAILEGRQTQFRRKIKPQPTWHNCSKPSYLSIDDAWDWPTVSSPAPQVTWKCPFGKPGDRLFVQEEWANIADDGRPPQYVYRLDDSALAEYEIWNPAITMPREASRITLEVKRVWVERIQDISAQDAIACGYDGDQIYTGHGDFEVITPVDELKLDRGKDWNANVFDWCVEFEKI